MLYRFAIITKDQETTVKIQTGNQAKNNEDAPEQVI